MVERHLQRRILDTCHLNLWDWPDEIKHRFDARTGQTIAVIKKDRSHAVRKNSVTTLEPHLYCWSVGGV